MMRWTRASGALLRVAAVSAALLLLAPPAAAAGFSWSGAHLWTYSARYAISGAAVGSQTWLVRVHGARTDLTIGTSLPGRSETDRLVVMSRGLALVSASEHVTAPSVSLAIAASVAHAKVSETAVVNGRHEKVSYTVGAATFENEALLPTLSGAPWRPGVRTVIQDIVLQHASIARIGLLVGKAVRLKTPAGTFTCLPVTISSAAGTQTAWVSTGVHPVLVRYKSASTTFTLTSVSP